MKRFIGSAIYALTHVHPGKISGMCLTMAACCCLTLSTGCKRHPKPTDSAPAKVGVMVIGAANDACDERCGNYSGTVEPEEESLVSFSVPGTITHIYVKEGQKVAKGEVLAKVKSESLGNERNIAAAELEQVRDLYNRLKKLHDQNALPDVKWVEVQAKLKQAENAVALADRAVGDATITSPISGYVTAKMADAGQSVLPAQPIIKIVDASNLRISIPVPENEINRFGKGTEANVAFKALDGLEVTGQMVSKEVEADPLTRSYDVKFKITDGGGRIMPGMIGSVYVSGLDTLAGAGAMTGYVLPSQAVLLNSDNRQFVWVVKDGRAERRFVSADELRTDGVAVKSGLERGDSLIVAGMQKVSIGSRVTVR